MGSEMTEENELLKGFDFAERLLGVAIDVVGAAHIVLNDNWARDPKVVGLALLSRSISNFRAAMILVREHHVMEAGVLARCIYENLLWSGALRERGLEFVKEMLKDDAANRKAVSEFALKGSSHYGGDADDHNAQRLREHLRELAARFPKTKKLRADKISEHGGLETAYVAYARLSLETVHCSVTALGRHLEREQLDNGGYGLVLNVSPEPRPNEARKTVIDLCRALIWVAIATNELLGFTSVSGRLKQLVDEFERDG